jgi:NTE family protein
MSCNIPVIFEPYKYGDGLYVDGGLTNNFPVDIGEKIGIRVIGLNIDTSEPVKFGTINTIEYAYKLLIISLNESVRCRISNKSETTDVISIRSADKTFKPFDFDITTKDKLCLFSTGYECAKHFYEGESRSYHPPP